MMFFYLPFAACCFPFSVEYYPVFFCSVFSGNINLFSTDCCSITAQCSHTCVYPSLLCSILPSTDLPPSIAVSLYLFLPPAVFYLSFSFGSCHFSFWCSTFLPNNLCMFSMSFTICDLPLFATYSLVGASTLLERPAPVLSVSPAISPLVHVSRFCAMLRLVCLVISASVVSTTLADYFQHARITQVMR